MQRAASLSESTDNGIRASKRNANGAVSGVSSELKNLVADIEDFITATTSLTGEDLERAKQKLSEKVAAAKESMGELSDNLMDRARKTATATNDYVHDQPWTAIGVGAALGILVGFLVSRRV